MASAKEAGTVRVMATGRMDYGRLRLEADDEFSVSKADAAIFLRVGKVKMAKSEKAAKGGVKSGAYETRVMNAGTTASAAAGDSRQMVSTPETVGTPATTEVAATTVADAKGKAKDEKAKDAESGAAAG